MNLIAVFRRESEKLPIADLIRLVLEKSGYQEALKEEGDLEAQARMENIEELISKDVDFDRDFSDV